jgi:hypothetical protein
MILVLESSRCVGFLCSAGVKGVQAYDRDGKRIGLFTDKEAAAAAVTAPSSMSAPWE